MAAVLPIDAPMLPPLVLRPPLGPSILRGFVLILAGIFHVLTAGWNVIMNGTEGGIAGAARLLAHSQRWLPVSLPGGEPDGAVLTVWLSKLSMSFFGVNEFAARLPVALAIMAAVWFTLRIGERSGGIWRGFVAGLIFLCSPGAFTIARLLTPAPIATAFISAAFYCLISGAKRRPGRRQWYLLSWVAMACGAFTGGLHAAAVPLGAVSLLLPFYREASIRFRRLISWEGSAIAALTVTACWPVSGGGALLEKAGAGIAWLPALLFPWSLLLLPAAWRVMRQMIRFQRLEWAEAVPLAWIASGTILGAFAPEGALMQSLLIWPAVAVWAAIRLETLSRQSLLKALGAMMAAAVAGFVMVAQLRSFFPVVSPDWAGVLPGIPDSFWPTVTPVGIVALLAFGMMGAGAFLMEWRNRRRFTVLTLFGAMIPAGYAFADITAKFAPYFSYADMAHCIEMSRNAPGKIIVAGTPMEADSLRFYLRNPSQSYVTVAPGAAVPILGNEKAFLIVRRARLPEMKPLIRGPVRVFSESGGSVLLECGPRM